MDPVKLIQQKYRAAGSCPFTSSLPEQCDVGVSDGPGNGEEAEYPTRSNLIVYSRYHSRQF